MVGGTKSSFVRGYRETGGSGDYLQCRRPESDPWGWEDSLEKEMATHSSILTWTEEPGRLQSMGLQKSRTQLSN